MFADFLDEAGLLLDNRRLNATAKEFRALEPAWGSLCKALLPDEIAPFKETRQLMLQKRDAFHKKGAAASAEIKKIHTRLGKIRASMETKFPLKGSAEPDFKENLRAAILRVYDLEHKAITALDGALEK